MARATDFWMGDHWETAFCLQTKASFTPQEQIFDEWMALESWDLGNNKDFITYWTLREGKQRYGRLIFEWVVPQKSPSESILSF
jgi:hypothetical protein